MSFFLSVRKSAWLAGAALALASCAPTITTPQLGRIVNSQTGVEGTVAFTRGTLRPLVSDPFAPENARIEIGGVAYTGRTQVVGAGLAPVVPANWGLSVSVGNTAMRPAERDPLAWNTRFDAPRSTEAVSYSGNLIARSSAPNVKTLTCNLLIDTREHGIGECFGNDGVKYALQF